MGNDPWPMWSVTLDPLCVTMTHQINTQIQIHMHTVNKDLQKIGFTWEEAEVAALDRHGWRRSIAQCVQLDAGWIKVKVKVISSVYVDDWLLFILRKSVNYSVNLLSHGNMNSTRARRDWVRSQRCVYAVIEDVLSASNIRWSLFDIHAAFSARCDSRTTILKKTHSPQ